MSGYFQMLTATGDSVRMAACATDAARHERMLDITSGDAAALTEVGGLGAHLAWISAASMVGQSLASSTSTLSNDGASANRWAYFRESWGPPEASRASLSWASANAAKAP